jgi:hypothetical protein
LFTRPGALLAILGSTVFAAILALWWYWGETVLLGIANAPFC